MLNSHYIDSAGQWLLVLNKTGSNARQGRVFKIKIDLKFFVFFKKLHISCIAALMKHYQTFKKNLVNLFFF